MSEHKIRFELIGVPEYQAALKKPKQAFSDPDLQEMTVTKNSLGWPAANTGGFAAVYRLVPRDHRRARAVRCFIKLAPDLADRYAKISAHLARVVPMQENRQSFLLQTSYQAEGVRIESGKKPITTMPWIDGRPLDAYMDLAIAQPHRLPRLRTQIERLERTLARFDMAHGDLQHRNVLIEEDGSLRLIDYDGMFVPELTGRVSNEEGVADFQHPGRTWEHFGPGMDRFSFLVLYLTVLAVERHPEVWRQESRSEGLLLREADFLDPDSSSTLALLAQYDDLDPYVRLFKRICRRPFTETPALPDYIREVGAITTVVAEPEAPLPAPEPVKPTPVPLAAAAEVHDVTSAVELTAPNLDASVGQYVTMTGAYERFTTNDGPSGPYRSLHLRGPDGSELEVIADPVVVQQVRDTGRSWKVNPGQKVTATGILLSEAGHSALLLEQAAGLVRGPVPRRKPGQAGGGFDDGGLFGDWLHGRKKPLGSGPAPSGSPASKTPVEGPKPSGSSSGGRSSRPVDGSTGKGTPRQ